MSVNNFDVLKEMGKRNLNIQMAPLGNIIKMRKLKAGTQVTIGVAGDVITRITFGEVVGGLILADKKQFDDVKGELETSAVQSPVSPEERKPDSGSQGGQP